MKKLIPILALIPAIALALTPPWSIKLDCTINSLFWLWMVFLSGFLSFAYVYQRVSVWLKLFVIWAFVVCFISRAPYMSFTMFWSVIVCAYYYALCKKIQDWTLVKKAVQALFFFISLLIIMQMFGKDTLLNFNQKDAVILGTIGNYMILGTYVCVLAPFLIFTPINWIPLVIIAFITGSTGTLLAVLSGLGVLIWKTQKRLRLAIVALLLAVGIVGCMTHEFDRNVLEAGRLPVWKRTIEVTNKKPLGSGLGTYKVLFPLLSQDLESSKATVGEWEYENTKGKGLAWRRAHNDWLQILFEVGYPGFIFFILWLVSIVQNVLKGQNTLKLAGLTILGTVMIFHFPARMCQSVLLLLMFLAYCEQKEKPDGNV